MKYSDFIKVCNMQAMEYAKSPEGKKSFIDSTVEFFNNGDYGYFMIDDFVKEAITDEDWKEIAEKVGENICVQGNLVYKRGAKVPSELLPKWFIVNY